MAIQVISDLHNQINTALGTTLANKAGEIINIISPVIMSAFLLYVLLVTISYMKNGSDLIEIGGDLIQRFIGWAVIIGLSMNIGNFNDIVVPMAKGIPVEIMNVFIKNGGDPYAQLDTLVNTYLDTMIAGWDNANGIEGTMMAVVICLILIISAIVAVVITVAYLLFSELFVAVLLTIAPIFIALALFPVTRQYASLWVAQIVNAGLLLILTSAVTSIQIMVLNGFVIPASSELTWSFALQVALVSGVFAVLIMQSPSIASALSGGMTLGGYQATGRAIAGGMRNAKGAYNEGKGKAMGGLGMGKSAYGAIKGRLGGGGGNTIKPEGAGK